MSVHKVEFYIEDKNLGRASRALTGIGAKNVRWVPQSGATVDKGEVREVGGNATSAVGAEIMKLGRPVVGSGDIKAAAKAAGYSPDSYTYYANGLVKTKVLKKTSTPGQFKVMKGK